MKLTYSELAKIKTALLYFATEKVFFQNEELKKYLDLIEKINEEEKKVLGFKE